MELVKKCPTCKTENPPSEMMCSRCFGDISGVVPGGRPETVPAAEAACLRLVTGDGETITIRDGETVGRSATGRSVLARFDKVSRRHAAFSLREGQWLLTDLGSSNGTYLDGGRVAAGEMVPVLEGQKIRFSSAFEATVVIPP